MSDEIHKHTNQQVHVLRARHRLSKDDDYRRVFDANTRKHDGPITLFALPNGLGQPRLGLSISKRRLGSAVARNAMKRRLREAFRLIPKDELGGYDYLVTVKPHTLMPSNRYEASLRRLASKLRKAWEKRDVEGREVSHDRNGYSRT